MLSPKWVIILFRIPTDSFQPLLFASALTYLSQYCCPVIVYLLLSLSINFFGLTFYLSFIICGAGFLPGYLLSWLRIISWNILVVTKRTQQYPLQCLSPVLSLIRAVEILAVYEPMSVIQKPFQVQIWMIPQQRPSLYAPSSSTLSQFNSGQIRYYSCRTMGR